MKGSGDKWLRTVALMQLILHVGKQGTPTVKAFNHLYKGMALSVFISGYIVEMSRKLNHVTTMAGGTTYVLLVLTSVSNVEVGVRVMCLNLAAI